MIRTIKKENIESITYADIVKMTVRIINLDKPEEYIEVESFGRGLDSGDKGFGKASTYARKYALLNAYKIATGEDPDDVKSKEMLAMKTLDEKRVIVSNFLLSDNNKCTSFLQRFNKGSIEELDAKEIEMIYDGMRKRGIV